jgi:hypothetical protein
MLGAAGVALGTASVSVHAVTADNVICAGCVQSTDIADGQVTTADIRNFTVSSADMNPNILLGSATAGGRLPLTTANPAAFCSVVHPAGTGIVRSVRAGQLS